MPFLDFRSGNGLAGLALVFMLLLPAMPAMALNGCFDNWQDRRGEDPVLISANNCVTRDYTPRCVIVSAGSTVRFEVSFSCHPTFSGVVSNGMGTIDPGGPFGPWQSGTTQEVTLNDLGEFPYFCDLHLNQGMFGSVWVAPEFYADGFENTAP